jgi:hypothetical protein
LTRFLVPGAQRPRVLLLAALAAACGEPAGPATASPLAGDWSYEARDDTGQLALEGTLHWRAVTGASAAVEGTVQVIETGPDGSRTITGTCAGQIHADSIAEFSLLIDDVSRPHIGILRTDSITGAWTAFSAVTAHGTFRLRRVLAVR